MLWRLPQLGASLACRAQGTAAGGDLVTIALACRTLVKWAARDGGCNRSFSAEWQNTFFLFYCTTGAWSLTVSSSQNNDSDERFALGLIFALITLVVLSVLGFGAYKGVHGNKQGMASMGKVRVLKTPIGPIRVGGSGV